MNEENIYTLQTLLEAKTAYLDALHGARENYIAWSNTKSDRESDLSLGYFALQIHETELWISNLQARIKELEEAQNGCSC